MNLISMDPKRVRSVISDGNADFSGYTMLHAMLENIMNIGLTKKGISLGTKIQNVGSLFMRAGLKPDSSFRCSLLWKAW